MVAWGPSYVGYKKGSLPGPDGKSIFLRSPTPLKNQRTGQACEKCRERKAKVFKSLSWILRSNFVPVQSSVAAAVLLVRDVSLAATCANMGPKLRKGNKVTLKIVSLAKMTKT